jgi:uncharacterized membrane protein YbhN (UPF0104 family)
MVLVVIVWYLYAHAEDFLLLGEFDFRYLPVLLAVPFAAILINGRILQILLRQFGIELSFAEWYGLTVIHAFGNYLPVPQGGSIARGIYLKKSYGLEIESFTATVVVTYVEFLTCLGLIGLIVSMLFGLGGPSLPWPFWLLFAGLAALVLAVLPLRWPLPFGSMWQGFRDALATLRRRHVLLRVATYQCMLIALNMFGLWLTFASLERPVSATASALVSLMSMASGIINLTPGNLGVAESAAWITAQMSGGNAQVAVVAFTVFRLMSMVVIFGLTPVFTSRLSVEFGIQATARETREANTNNDVSS